MYGENFASVTDRLGANDLQQARLQHGDFGEHEEGILKTLRDMNVPVNAVNLQGAYELSRGRKVIEQEALARRESGGIIPARPDTTPPPKVVELDEEEKMVAKALNMTEEDYAINKDPKHWNPNVLGTK